MGMTGNIFNVILYQILTMSFVATNDGEVAMAAGEELIVLEMDNDGSGWTKVLRGDSEGYVPTAYIQIE